MSTHWKRVLALLVLVAVGTAFGMASMASARPPENCPDIWEPVICSDGQVYSNICYARLAGARHCVPYDG